MSRQLGNPTIGQLLAQRHATDVHEGEGTRVDGEDYVRLVGRIDCLVTQAVSLEDSAPYLKLIACLIFVESFYASSVSFKVIQTLATGLFKGLRSPLRATPVDAGGASQVKVEYKFYTRIPCIRPEDLPRVGGSARRCFSVVGDSNRCGFIEYKFDAEFRHLQSDEVSSVEQQYYQCAEDNLSDLKCNEAMKKIREIKKQFSEFRLSDYLSLLDFSHKGKQFGKHQAFPSGWLDSPSEEGEAASTSSSSAPTPKKKGNLFKTPKLGLFKRKQKY